MATTGIVAIILSLFDSLKLVDSSRLHDMITDSTYIHSRVLFIVVLVM